MDSLPRELVAQIVGLASRRSKESLSSWDSPWQPIASEYHQGEFDLFIDLHVNSAAPSFEYDVYIERLLSGSTFPWDEEVAKDAHLVRDVHLSISNNFKWKTSSSGLEEDFRFIRKVFALARHGRRMHLTLDVQNNGQEPPKQCDTLRRLLDLVPYIPVVTVDRHNAFETIRSSDEESRKYGVFDVLRSLLERLRVPYFPRMADTLLNIPEECWNPDEISEPDSYLEKYYLGIYPKHHCCQVDLPFVGVRYAGFPDKDTFLIDFVAYRNSPSHTGTLFSFLSTAITHADRLFNGCRPWRP
uniref:F-box domain-containing protein n=1 Tax=Steinernema glaseri TaxID=37863 RepID=A0A1I8AIK0_9BILA